LAEAKGLRINEQIRVREVRLIDDEGEQKGIVPTIEDLKMAKEREFDLVEVAPNANPPVCKILDYGKYKFEQEKKLRDSKKNQKVIELKEIYLSMTIDVGDLNVKAKKTVEMLGDGNKVKVSIRMRGRQMAHASMGVDVMHRFFDILGGKATMEKEPKTEGRNITMVLAPAK
jgi:translation initiation factor IF-3